MAIRDDVLACLRSERGANFLAALLSSLGVSARGGYVEAGNPLERAHAIMRCHNELILVVVAQLRQTLGIAGAGYPDDTFVDVLSEKSKGGDCAGALRWAVEQALGDTSSLT